MWYPMRFAVRVLPFTATYWIGSIGGALLSMISKEKRLIMSEELKLSLKDLKSSEIDSIVRASFRNYAVSEIEVLLYPTLDAGVIKRLVTIEGREHLDSALAEGRGVLLFQAHFGAFQMVMPAIGYSGYTMSQISASAALWKDDADADIQKRSFDIKAEYEYTLPVTHISVKSSLRPAFRALGRGEIVGITVDGGGGNKVEQVDFIGRVANFQQGGADLAIRTGAAVVPAFIVTHPGLRHTLTIHPALKFDSSATRQENIRSIMQSFASILERYVYDHPDHYAYSLYLRKVRGAEDPFPFFVDPETTAAYEADTLRKRKGINHA